MKSYQLTKKLLLGVCATYLLTVIYMQVSGRREIFPVFDWSLFASKAKLINTDFSILVRTAHTQLDLRRDGPINATTGRAIENFGQALLHQNQAAIGVLKPEIDRLVKLHFPSTSRYEVVLRSFNVLEYLKTKQYEIRDTWSFTVNES